MARRLSRSHLITFLLHLTLTLTLITCVRFVSGGVSSCTDYTDCVACITDTACGYCGGNVTDATLGSVTCLLAQHGADGPQDNCSPFESWNFNDRTRCPTTTNGNTTDICNQFNGNCGSCTASTSPLCQYCTATTICSSSTAIGVTCSSGLITTCPAVVNNDPCLTQTTCGSCLAMSGCGYCPTSSRCLNGTQTGPIAETCTAQWMIGVNSTNSCLTCDQKFICTDCLTDAHCAWCPESGKCLANPNYGVSSTSNSYPGCTLYSGSSDSCPGTGNVNTGGDSLTSSSSGAAQFATAALALVIIFSIIAFLVVFKLKYFLPVLGRQTRASSRVILDDGSSAPSNAYAPQIMHHTISVDSSANPYLKFVLFSGLFIMFLFNFIAMATNTYSITSVSDATRAALKSTANPDSSITAGVVGFSGLNLISGLTVYDCSKFTSSDARACGTVSAAGGFLLFYALLSLILSLIILLWGAFIASHAHEKNVGIGAGKKPPALQFHPRLYTLSVINCVSLTSAILIWSLGGHLSLQTNIFVPYGSWSLGASWILLLICQLLSIPTLWFFWSVVEFAYVNDTTGAGTNDLNTTGGSDGDGLDLPLEDQEEAQIVKNQLTQ